ncbi:YqzL family protein [Bacillus sp. FJAT-49736]|nr:YqzL family protein [Bacillus sp. FJAT-49736]MBS4173570.1 YqzL family protein [Bacillus sp. FJAT-49736]
MLEFTWKFFTETGSIDTYLLFKELEKEGQDEPMKTEHEISEIDYPIS